MNGDKMGWNKIIQERHRRKELVKTLVWDTLLSDMELFLSLLHLVCLTSILCGNVSQLVLQLYTRRLRDVTHVQQFLAFFFVINAFVSLGTPWMIVETLVRHWTFGPSACRAYQATAQVGRTILPYIIVALYVVTVSILL